jgi:CheY-like chemotaxis protein
MFAKEWPVLFVDDDPDVLAVSRLALRNLEVDGVPVRLFTAASKLEALDLLNGPLSFAALPYLAVAFIDVVMETDTAGLDLCRYIRETQNNKLVQLFIRTGQPGVAPERQVIDRYDVNGYFSKVETTQDKLYSLVKAGVRQFDFARLALGELQVITMAIAAADSRESVESVLRGFLAQATLNHSGQPAHEHHMRLVVFDNQGLFAGSGYTPEEAQRDRQRLEGIGLQPLGNGDGMAIDGHDMLVKLAATDVNAETYHLSNYAGTPPPAEALLILAFTRSIAALVARAHRRARQPTPA